MAPEQSHPLGFRTEGSVPALLALILTGLVTCGCGSNTAEPTPVAADVAQAHGTNGMSGHSIGASPIAVTQPPPGGDHSGATVHAEKRASPTDAAIKQAERIQPADATLAGHDFAAQATALYRIAACGADTPLSARFDAMRIARHCRRMKRRYKSYRKRWLDKAIPYFAKLRPADVPTRVVYPFGGGDLVTALAVFPNAQEITTISLEAAGDPRGIDTLSGRANASALDRDLDTVGHVIGRLLRAAHSTTKSLQKASHNKLPGTLVFALAGMALHDVEPVSLRYFRIEPNGTLHYLSLEELEQGIRDFAEYNRKRRAKERVLRKAKLQVWRQQVAVFANMELRFRARGASLGEPIRVYRHIVANLDNAHMIDAPGVLAHLTAKGDVAAMTKAASYLLWMDAFSTIRDYLVRNIVWMASDSSGIPPQFASAANLEQDAYGSYSGPYFYYRGRTAKKLRRQFAALWASPTEKLPFRFGYPDSTRKGNHLLITHRPAVAPGNHGAR